MKSYTAIKAAVLSMALFSNVAWAGYVYWPEVYIGDASTYADGSKIGARYSSDSQQYIGCSHYSVPGGSAAWCSAHDSGEKYFICYTSDPNMIETIRAENDMSYLYVSADYNGGTCSLVFIDNSSYVQ